MMSAATSDALEILFLLKSSHDPTPPSGAIKVSDKCIYLLQWYGCDAQVELTLFELRKLQKVCFSYLDVAHNVPTRFFAASKWEMELDVALSCAWCVMRCQVRSVVTAGTQPCPMLQRWRHCRYWFIFLKLQDGAGSHCRWQSSTSCRAGFNNEPSSVNK